MAQCCSPVERRPYVSGVSNETTDSFVSHYLISQTTPTLCLAFFGNDLHQPVERQPSQVPVRYLASVIAAFSYLLTTHSQETAIHRCCQDVIGHFQGIFRCVSAPQVVFRRHQRPDQALRGAYSSETPQLQRPTSPSNTRM